MRAVLQRRYGSPDLLMVGEAPEPVPAKGEVLVRVHAAPLHPDVWHVVAGLPHVLRLMGAGVRRPKNPIPGIDMAGTVERPGPGADRFPVGCRVFGETIPKMQWVNGGAFAELVAVREEQLEREAFRHLIHGDPRGRVLLTARET